jgi:chromate transporter
MTLPAWNSIDWGSLVLTAAAAVATFRFRVGMLKVLAGCAAGGIVMKWLLGA